MHRCVHRRLPLLALPLLALVLAACGSGTATVESADGGSTASVESSASVSTSTSTSVSTSASVSTSIATAPTPASSTEAPTAATQVVEMDRGVIFASPSGNIACVMGPVYGASCWIAEHDWLVESATEPGCEFDYGDAVDVTAEGVVWPCYSDFSWGPAERTLAYGDAIVTGPFRCESAETGITCRNGDGRGFTVARATVDTF